MSDFLLHEGALAPVPPLKSLKKNGEPRTRRPKVETQLGRILAIPPAKLIDLIPRIFDESVVHLARHGQEGDKLLQAAVWTHLMQRTTRKIRATARRLKKAVVDEISMTVEMQIMEPLLRGEPEELLDFLEIGFSEGVHAKTVDAMRVHARSTLGNKKRGWLETDELGVDGTIFTRPLELVPDTAPSAEEIAIEIQMMRKAAESVENPEQWQAIEMHYLQGLPIQSADPEKADMVRELHATEGEIRHRIRYGIKAIRQAFLPPEPDKGGAE